VDDAGELVLLENQDRRRWDQRLISMGFAHFDRSMSGPDVSEYHVQAAIAASHARAVDPAAVDWALILALYDQLLTLNTSPIVALNRAVAIARVHGPSAALAAIAGLEADPKLRQYHLLMSVRGQLLLDLGRTVEAAESFTAAFDHTRNEPERRFLRRRIEACLRGSR
jgi:RNA polymerase sigma-70 factor, ECF subfamily